MTTVVHAGDSEAYAAAVSRARTKLAEYGMRPSFGSLSTAHRARLREACARDLPSFADRVNDATITDVGAPFFARVRILRLDSALPFPALVAYAALTPTHGPIVLTGRPEGLRAMCEDEPPPSSDPDLATVLANLAGAWTGASVMLEVRVSGVDEIPFRRVGPHDAAWEREVRLAHGSRITPPALERLDDGVRVTSWLVSESRLRRRAVAVRSATIDVTEEVVAELPVHPGRMWGAVDGRLIPVG